MNERSQVAKKDASVLWGKVWCEDELIKGKLDT